MSKTTAKTAMPVITLEALGKIKSMQPQIDGVNKLAKTFQDSFEKQLGADDELLKNTSAITFVVPEAAYDQAALLPAGMTAEQVKAVHDNDDRINAALSLAVTNTAVKYVDKNLETMSVTTNVLGIEREAVYQHKYTSGVGENRAERIGRVSLSTKIAAPLADAACTQAREAVRSYFTSGADEAVAALS